MKITRQVETDVMVVGGGGAGLRAALAAAEAGSRVLVVNKGPIGKSGITLTAAGGMQAPFHPDDSPDEYFQDIVRCGGGIGDKKLARVLAQDACERVLDAERYGARFIRNPEGGFSLGQFPGQSKPRNLFVKGGGVGLVAALANACRAHPNITLLDDVFVTGLLTSNAGGKPAAAGALGLCLRTGELVQISAKAVVLATGGCQWLWAVTDCPTDATGEGLVYAYRAGAELVDMEMVLFYPSVIVWPPSLKGAFVHYEFLAEDVLDGNVYDCDGRPVLPKPLPVRDEAMLIMARAIQAGKGQAHGGLHWYVGDSPKGQAAVEKKLDIAQYNYIKAHGVNPATDKIEVAPGAHYLMGGIHITEECQSTLAGLFATPECAGNFDGANRLAGNGVTATQVFGARAGAAAHRWAAAQPGHAVDAASLAAQTERVARKVASKQQAAIKLQLLREQLRSAVQAYAGVERDAQGLNRLAQIAAAIEATVNQATVPPVSCYNQQLVDLLQLETMCTAARLIAGSALLRQESRGHHVRRDFPQQDGQWCKHTTVAYAQDGPVFGTRPVE